MKLEQQVTSLIESGIAKFFEIEPLIIDDESSTAERYAKFITSFATNVHNAAIESALEALPEEGEVPSTVEEAMFNTFKNGISRYSELARTKLSALKKEI